MATKADHLRELGNLLTGAADEIESQRSQFEALMANWKKLLYELHDCETLEQFEAVTCKHRICKPETVLFGAPDGNL